MTSDAPIAEEAVVAAARRLGRYTLYYRIAQGGMASVYLAQLTSEVGFSKWVAIKMIHPHIASDPQFVQMFLNEARLAARLDHPNLCSVHDFGESDGRYYLAMDYLHGESLGQLSRVAWIAGGMPYALAARIIADAARGLHSAHETRQENGANAGVVHRDVSPQNLFVLYTGVAKVVDFGIARSNDASGERTATGILKGKLAYMSPEQIEEHPVDRRTDLWALGVVLWEVTTGQRLFKRPNDAATLMAVLRDEIPPPSSLNADYPKRLEAVVMKALERDPARRYQSGTEMARALEAWLASERSPVGTDEVGELMQTLFAERIAFRDQLLHPSSGSETMDVVAQWGGLAGDSDLPGPGASPVSPRKGDRVRVSEPSPVMELSQVKAMARLAMPRPAASGMRFNMELPQPAGELLDRPPDAIVRPSDRTGRQSVVVPRRDDGRTGIATGVLLGVLLVLGGVVFVTAPWRVAPSPRPDPTNEVVRSLPSIAPPSVQTPPVHNVPEDLSAHIARTPVVHDAAPPSIPTVPLTAPGTKLPLRVVRPMLTAVRPRVDDASVEVRPGFLNLTADPPVEVFYGSQSLGVSPIVDHPLPVGRQVLRLVPRDGSEERTVTVDVHSGESVITDYHWH